MKQESNSVISRVSDRKSRVKHQELSIDNQELGVKKKLS